MAKGLMLILTIIMLTASVSAQEKACPCEKPQVAKVLHGVRGPVGPAGPQGNPGIPGQVPQWYLYLGIAGVFFGLLGTGLAFGALVSRPNPQAVQPMNVFNNVPGPGGHP